MREYTIGIDLATRKIGVVMIDNSDNTWIVRRTFDFPKFSWNNENYVGEIVIEFTKLFKTLLVRFQREKTKVNLAIELANFSKASQTQAYAYIAGIIQTLFMIMFSTIKTDVFIYNANAWFQQLAKEYDIKSFTKIKRDERKEITKQCFIKEKQHDKKYFTQDEIDAYYIAKYFNKVKGELNGTSKKS